MITKEEISSLGFELNENCNWYTKDKITIAAANVIYGHSGYIQIWLANEKIKCDLLLFQGTVNSKAELIVLLEQVNGTRNTKKETDV
jgi:hypothetical protein